MKRQAALLVAFVALLAPLAAQNRTALLIANGNYASFGKLANPVPEARALKSALEGLGFQAILVEDASREAMVDALADFEAALRSRGGIAFFHYGGHGVQVGGRNYLIPADADIPDEKRVASRTLDLDEVMAALDASGSGINIVVLDACRNNPLPATSGRSASRGLAVVGAKPRNSIIVYSAESGSVAQDGLFTPALTRALATPGLDLGAVVMQVRREVYEKSGGAQTPGEYSQLFEPVYLAGAKAAAVPATEAGGVLSIGGVGPLSGAASSYGISAKLGMELAVAERNARGGVLGHLVKLVSADDKGDPAEGAAVFTRLIQEDKVVAIVGAVMSSVSLAGAPIAQAAKIPMISPTSTNEKVTLVGDYIFRACFIDPFQGRVGAKFAFNDLKAKTAACIFDAGNDYAKGLFENFQKAYVEIGGKVIAYEAHPAGATDFKAQLARIVRAKPDVIYCPDFYNDAARIAIQARELGFMGPIVGGDGWESPEFVKIGGASVENCFFTNHYAPDATTPAVAAFIRDFKAAYGSAPDSLAALSYDATSILLDAIERAGTASGPALRDAIASTDLSLVSGKVRFDEMRDPVKSATVVQIKGGRQVYRTTIDP